MVKPQTIIGKIFTMEEPIVRGKLPFYMGLQYPPPPINTGKGKLHVENKTWIVSAHPAKREHEFGYTMSIPGVCS